MVGMTYERLAKTGLTGRYQFRRNWRGCIILQVEFMFTGYASPFSFGIIHEPRWRDASALDLADLKGLGVF